MGLQGSLAINIPYAVVVVVVECNGPKMVLPYTNIEQRTKSASFLGMLVKRSVQELG